jgi:hypothetical protein
LAETSRAPSRPAGPELLKRGHILLVVDLCNAYESLYPVVYFLKLGIDVTQFLLIAREDQGDIAKNLSQPQKRLP